MNTLPQRSRQAQQLSIVARTMLDMFRVFGEAYLKRKRFGSSADELLLLAAVFVGQSEGRPMNSSKLSDYAGMPRPTVIRKLHALARRGVLERIDGGLYALPEHVVNGPAVMRAAAAAQQQIRRAAASLDH